MSRGARSTCACVLALGALGCRAFSPSIEEALGPDDLELRYRECAVSPGPVGGIVAAGTVVGAADPLVESESFASPYVVDVALDEELVLADWHGHRIELTVDARPFGPWSTRFGAWRPRPCDRMRFVVGRSGTFLDVGPVDPTLVPLAAQHAQSLEMFEHGPLATRCASYAAGALREARWIR